jgi:hypothetical protein
MAAATRSPRGDHNDVDREEFEEALAGYSDESDGQGMDGHWPAMTSFLSFLHDLQALQDGRFDGRFSDRREILAAEAGAAVYVLVEEIFGAFNVDGAQTKQFHSYAICRDRLRIIGEALDSLAHNDAQYD